MELTSGYNLACGYSDCKYTRLHCDFTPDPYVSFKVRYGSKLTCYGGRRKIFWEMWYLLQGLESEGMGLPRDLSSSATCIGFTPALHYAMTISTVRCHTPTLHRGVKADVRSG